MGLFKYSKCIIRGSLVQWTPEEIVRQGLLQRMLVLGYPKGLISVERKLVKRRYDVVCFMQTMKPLLLVECKATALDTKAAMQAFGYKGLLEAPFVTLIGPEEIMTYWQGKEGYEAVPFLPSHKELYAMSRRF